MNKEMKLWMCSCGQEVLSVEHPKPIRWTDGHVCHFFEVKDQQSSHRTETDEKAI